MAARIKRKLKAASDFLESAPTTGIDSHRPPFSLGRMSARCLQIRVSALLGFFAILLGSFGAHGAIHQTLVANGGLENWKTAVLYHLTHAILLVCLPLFPTGGGHRRAFWAWNFLALGLLLFCGSVYLNAYTQNKAFAHGAPFGGLSLMIGWVLLLCGNWSRVLRSEK